MSNIAEKAILGTLMQNSYLFKDTELTLEHFTNAIHKNIFLAIKRALNELQTCDVVTLLATNNPETLGGATYLTELQNFNNVKNFDKYLQVIYNNWKEVQKNNILNLAISENWSVENITKRLDQLSVNQSNKRTSIQDLIIRDLEKPFVKTEMKTGATTGIKDFDKATNGLQDSELIIIAGRPSMGKSDVMLKIASSAGHSKRYLPLIFSLEMSEDLLFNRLIASAASYNRSHMVNPYHKLNDEEKERWMPTLGELSHTNIEIFDTPNQKVSSMRNDIRRTISLYPGLKPLVLIDYLTLIKPENETGNTHKDVGTITKSLKALAKEFDCPVVVLAQLSRSIEQRQNKRPMMSDLRESGSIEEDADVIAFVYRDDYYNSDTEEKEILELIISKQRNGGVGTIKAIYKKEVGRIIDIDWNA